MTSALNGTAVLVVDDDADNVDVFGLVMVHAGALVRTARSGREALDALSDWNPDVLLLDISMPDMDGIDLLAAIRRIERLRDVPAVAISGKVSASDKERAFSKGFGAYLTKPFSGDALVGLVEWLVEPRRRYAEAPTPVSLP